MFENSSKYANLTSKISEVSMAATTKMSSKGQVVIPEEIRDNLKLKEGDQFIVIGQGDTVILKSITPPSLSEFSDLMKEAARTAKSMGLKKSDLEKAIKKVRKEK
jgi:AbrB family looped-hinge helix DNA binding protein